MDREKVINKVKAIVADMQEEVDEWKDYSDSELRGGLTCDCDWWYKTLQTLKDALALLKAQEPRLLTIDEIHDSMVVYLEAGTEFLKRMDDDGVVLAIGGSECTGAKCFITVWNVGIAGMNNDYNVTWRAWSQRPTKEQREREPWDRRTRNDQC